VAGILSSFWLLNSTYRKARGRPECQDIRTAAFCVMLALAGFCTAVTFLNFGYSFHLPAMAGLTVALSRAAKQEFESRSAGSAVFAASWQKGSPAGPLVPPARETPQRFNRSPA
jgi:hypothetical protein